MTSVICPYRCRLINDFLKALIYIEFQIISGVLILSGHQFSALVIKFLCLISEFTKRFFFYFVETFGVAFDS